MMKIFAFSVREDEREAFARFSKETGAEVILSEETPSLENTELVTGCEGISVLGMGQIDRPLLAQYQKLGVRFVSTRTIGYNHIDLNAAKELGISVCNASYPPNGVADFTVMMILMCLRHYKQAMWRGQVNDFSLQGLQGRDLKDLTAGAEKSIWIRLPHACIRCQKESGGRKAGGVCRSGNDLSGV